MSTDARLDAAVTAYRRRPTRAAVAELVAAQRAWGRDRTDAPKRTSGAWPHHWHTSGRGR